MFEEFSLIFPPMVLALSSEFIKHYKAISWPDSLWRQGAAAGAAV